MSKIDDMQKKQQHNDELFIAQNVIEDGIAKAALPKFALSKRLREDMEKGHLTVIAGCKLIWKCSASLKIPPELVAKEYVDAGISAISVLGMKPPTCINESHIKRLAMASPLPVLHTEIDVQELHISYARLHGASAVQLNGNRHNSNFQDYLLDHAQRNGLDCLVNVHNKKDLDFTLNNTNADTGIIISCDNAHLGVSIALCEQALEQDRMVVGKCEPNGGTIAKLRQASLRAFLVEESHDFWLDNKKETRQTFWRRIHEQVNACH